ncbi:hypothetical protein VNI00_001661 [Paramarasmius palmivorus]|uniref:Uncharacterized protein n=1 Tax=Paramarasmius palmivorus TaxID=297713 RepID=A0AAW0E503_9AGAR
MHRDTKTSQSLQANRAGRHFSISTTVLTAPSLPHNTAPEHDSSLPQDNAERNNARSAMNGHATSSEDHDVPPTSFHDHPNAPATASTHPSHFLHPSTHPIPETRKALCRNLQVSLSAGVPLPRMIDYHDRYPDLRSTHSFNLLISLALRRSSFGTVQWLLRSMDAAHIPHNILTQKMTVRWLVSTGYWDRAWKLVTTAKSSDSQSQAAAILWMEFFNGLARGVEFKQLMDREDTQWQRGYAPAFGPSLHHGHRLQVLHFVVHALLQLKQPKDASSLTKRYLNTVSGKPGPFPMKLVHLFVAFGSYERGLLKFHESRKALMSFLLAYSFLRPTPTTLFLLLGNLRTAKRCGTVAWDTYNYFKGRWGRRVDDQRVRRRVASLAVKEGRLDIVERLLGSSDKKAPSPRLASDASDARTGKGREKHLWIRLLARRNRRIRKNLYDPESNNGNIASLG